MSLEFISGSNDWERLCFSRPQLRCFCLWGLFSVNIMQGLIIGSMISCANVITLWTGGGYEPCILFHLKRELKSLVQVLLTAFFGTCSTFIVLRTGDNEPRSEISLLHSDGENETERQEAKPPSPPVSLPLHAAAVEPNGATVSPTIPRGTEVISIDSDGEEEEDDDEEPQVVHCTLPPKGTAPSNYGERRPCQSGDFHPHRSTPNLHPSAFSLGNPQLVTQISEQRVISVSSNVFGCPVTSAKTELSVPTSGA
nr:unnamed protein product [Spirometra erinaceieuropaei]